MSCRIVARAAAWWMALLQFSFTMSAAETPRDLSLFLLIGQSNMAGRGPLEDHERGPTPGVWMLDKDGAWVPAIDPVHFDRPERVGVGPAISFATTVRAARPDRAIGLIPCAVGGTRLDQWTPGGELFTTAVVRAKLALPSGRLRGILWHQGESDCGTEAAAHSYATRWKEMLAALRRELAADDVPVLVGGIGDFLDRPFTAVVNTQLASLAAPAEHIAFVSANGLASLEDRIHFSTVAQREFGRRYARAFLLLAP